MRADILQSSNMEQVRIYLDKKFRTFDSWTYSKDRRDRKCANYYLCASDLNKPLVEATYFRVFRSTFPRAVANEIQMDVDRKAVGPVMLAREDWISTQEDRQDSAEQLLKKLIQWKEDGDYQNGEQFFLEMQMEVAKFDASLVNPREFLTEAELKRVAHLTGKTTRNAKEVQAEFEGLIGIQQSAGVTFEAYSKKWGQVTAALKEDFKVGAWASGNAKAALSKKGIDLELQAAAAFGCELNIDGNCTWKLADHGLDLSGNCNLFAGANANLSAQLSADLLKGFNASIQAGAFAGVSASVTGNAKFTYLDKTVVGASATASVQFGVGGTISGTISAPIFGSTSIDFSTSASIGLGFGVSTNTEVNFSQIYLMGRDDFRRICYLPTIARGYRMDLMTQDAKNLHYLEKCIARIGDGVKDLGEKIESVKKVKPEKQSLLIRLDD
jgi:hypothetical protein